MPGSDRALEDLSDIPCAHELDERADWLMLFTTGGIEGWCPEGRMRQHQHAWAVVLDELCGGTLPPGAEGDPRVPDDDETDSEGVYEYESLPASPVEWDMGTGTDGSDGSGVGDGDDDGEMPAPETRPEDGLDSDMDSARVV